MTPVEVAAGYTAFGQGGMRAEPEFLREVVSANGTMLEKVTPQTHQVLDPRVAYLVTSVMKDVLNRGTGAGVRARGFTLPAAGKTGTSRDGWFAGFTSNLVCVIWVGFDDNRDLGLTGGTAVAPIWADFMMKATALPGYRNVKDFDPPEGVQTTVIDPESLELATPNCPTTKDEVFVAGSGPTQYWRRAGNYLVHRFLPLAYFWRRWRQERRAQGRRRAEVRPQPPSERHRAGERTRCLRGEGRKKESLEEDFWYLWG